MFVLLLAAPAHPEHYELGKAARDDLPHLRAARTAAPLITFAIARFVSGAGEHK